MVTGIVLVNVDRPQLRQVINDMMALEGVSEVYAVAGEYDLVVMIRVKTNAELAEIIATKKTLVTLEAQAKIDLEKVFNI